MARLTWTADFENNLPGFPSDFSNIIPYPDKNKMNHSLAIFPLIR
jgi:hypothetical protein